MCEGSVRLTSLEFSRLPLERKANIMPLSASGQYCDAIVATWKNRDNYTDAQECSDCELGLGKAQLSSPF